MASPFRRDDIRSQKLEYIRRAASDLFNKRGFHATSLDEVAAQVGISKPSIYYYYKNKSELLLGCYSNTLDICESLLNEAEIKGETPLKKICHFTRDLIYLHCSEGAIAVITEAESVPEDAIPQVRDRSQAITRRLKAWTAEGRKKGVLRADLGDITPMFAMGAVYWVPRWYNDEGHLSPDEIADAYISFLVDGITASPKR